MVCAHQHMYLVIELIPLLNCLNVKLTVSEMCCCYWSVTSDGGGGVVNLINLIFSSQNHEMKTFIFFT